MAAASDRAEVDTARPFRSVKEAVAVFGDRILVGHSHSIHSSSASTIATPNANTSAGANAMPTPSANHNTSSSSSTIMTFSQSPMAEVEEEIMPATVPMYSAPSSPPSLMSSPSPINTRSGCGDDRGHEEKGIMVMHSIQKLEAEVAETRQEVSQLRKRGNEMEMAVASLNAQLHRGLSKLAEMEADRAARRSIGGDTDMASTLRWGDKLAASEYLPSFSHALSLGEIDDAEFMGSRRRKAQKVKPIVLLIGDMLFSKRKSSKEKVDEGLYSGDHYSVVG